MLNLSPSSPPLGASPPPPSSPLPFPLRESCGQSPSLEKASWTVSTLGSWSGIFDIEPLEEDDDLLVPSTQRPLSPATNALDLPARQQKRPAVTQLRSCSASFQAFVNEKALEEVVDPALEKFESSPFAMEVDPSQFNPAALAANPLLPDWMSQSMGADEFSDLLPEFDCDADASAPTFFPSFPCPEADPCTTIDVSQVTFESLLASQHQAEPLPAPVFTPTAPVAEVEAEAGAEAPRKRGRPPKPITPSCKEVAAAASSTPRRVAAPEKLREPSPPSFPPYCGPLEKPSPDDKEAYDRYLRFRKSNNYSAHKSRLRRKEREKFNADMVSALQDQNGELKRELALLKTEFQQLQSMLDTYLQQQQQAKSN